MFFVLTNDPNARLYSRMEGVAVQEDFEQLVALHRQRIYRFALASLRDQDAAETVTQDCFLRAHRAWDGFRGDSSVQNWLMKIALNLIRDTARTRRFQFWKRAQSSDVLFDSADRFIPDCSSTPEAQLSARQQVKLVWRALDDVSANQRRVFLLHFMEGMSPAEIVEVTGMNNGVVRVNLHRAVRAVRQKLKGEK